MRGRQESNRTAVVEMLMPYANNPVYATASLFAAARQQRRHSWRALVACVAVCESRCSLASITRYGPRETYDDAMREL
jgi:hypothetical protein